jgi:hypothetical protein
MPQVVEKDRKVAKHLESVKNIPAKRGAERETVVRLRE